MATGKGSEKKAVTSAWFVPDTNFFLQCKPASDVDWSQVTDADEIVLVTVRTVQREIDTHKGGGNLRRSDRARAVAPLFKKLLREDEVHVYRQANPRVVMRRGPRLDPFRRKPALFDEQSNDDQIVEQVMATAAHLGQPIALLTQDSGPMQTAHDLGVPFIEIPDEWLIAPETGPAEKQVAALQRDLRELRNTLPALEVTALDGNTPVAEIRASMEYFEPADGALKAKVLWAVAKAYPSATKRGPLGLSVLYAEEAVAEYEKNRAEWLTGVEEAPDKVARHAHALAFVEVRLQLTNVGGTSADGVVAAITAQGPFNLVPMKAIRALEESGSLFPSPPKAPSRISSLSHYLANSLPHAPLDTAFLRAPAPPRNSRTFYWAWSGEGQQPEIRGECAEFRHRIHTETVSVPLLVPVEHQGDARGIITVTLSARNLPQTVVKRFKVYIQRSPGDLNGAVARRLKDELGVDLDYTSA